MDSDVSYFMVTYPVDPQPITRKSVVLGTPSTDPTVNPSIWIEKLNFNQTVVSPVASGQMVVTYSGFSDTDIYGLIKEGDCFRLFEVFGQSESVAAAFTGFIASIQISYMSGVSNGTQVIYQFYNLLGQWELQAAINNTGEQFSQGLSNLNSNLVPLGQVLALLFKGSLFELLSTTPSTAGGTVLNAPLSYGGIPLPLIIPGADNLQLSQQVFAYIATNASKLTTLEKTLYPYQHIFYQLPNGQVVLDFLRPVKNTNSVFNFSRGSASSGAQGPSLNFTQVQVIHAGAMVPNRIVSTLVNMPFFPPDQGFPENFVASIDNPFTRPQALLGSGFFEVQQVDVDALSDQSITDPTMLTYMIDLIPKSGYFTTIVAGQPTVAGTYASRRLAQANFKETGLFITQPRKICKEAGLTPLGTMVQTAFPTYLDSDTSQMYCYSTSTTFDSRSGTVFTMQLCKQNAITAYWAPPVASS